MPTCLSGGAIGSDTEFTNAAINLGSHRVINYSFLGHKTPVPRNTIRILSPNELLSGEETIKIAAKYLRRNWSEYVGNTRKLIQRNFWQVKKTDAVYAVAGIKKDGRVSGGTGWAVTMAIYLGVPDIYVYSDGKWYRWFGLNDPNSGHWGKLIPPKPEMGTYTGIGSREITDNEVKAIWSLYE
jgi:hypothetical protein